MKASDIPAKFAIPFATNASGSYVRTVPMTSSDPAAASISLGFPPATATPVGAGGTPPNIADFNGVLKQDTAWAQWDAAAGPIGFDATFSAAIGGYPAGAVLVTAAGPSGNYWLSTADDNTTNPDTGGSNWTAYTVLGLASQAFVTTALATIPLRPPGDNTSNAASTAWVQAELHTRLGTGLLPVAWVRVFVSGTTPTVNGGVNISPTVTRISQGVYQITTTVASVAGYWAVSCEKGGTPNVQGSGPGAIGGATTYVFTFVTLADNPVDPDSFFIQIF